MIIDNPKCAITRACYTDPDVQRSYGELAEGYGFLICAIGDAIGDEDAIGDVYFFISFLPLFFVVQDFHATQS